MDLNVAKNLLYELKKSAKSTLDSIQARYIPKFADNITIELVEDRTYKYLENTYTTENILYRVLDTVSIKTRKFDEAYNGLLSDAINDRIIKPFLLVLDNEVISPYDITLISDDRYTYLELNDFRYYSVEYTNSTKLSGTYDLLLPRVVEDYSDESIVLSIVLSSMTNISKVSDVKLNDTSIGSFSSSGKITIDTSNFNTDASNTLSLTLSSVTPTSITLKSSLGHRRSISEVKCLLLKSYMDVSQSEYSEDDTIFILYKGMIISMEEYQAFTFDAKVTFINKHNDALLYAEGDAMDMEQPFPDLYNHRLWKENFLVFKNNYFHTDDVEDMFTNMTDLETFINDNLYFKVFFETRTAESIDNVFQVPNPENLDRYSTKKMFADKIFEAFDLTDYSDLNIDEQVLKSFEEIFNYNSRLLDDYFESMSGKDTWTYSGQDIIDKGTYDSDNDVYTLNISKFITKINDNGIVVYYNSVLYSNAYISESDTQFSIMFDASSITEDDIIAINIYKNINNKTISFKINSADETRPYPSIYNDIDDILIFSKTPQYQYFGLEDSSDRMYAVDYSITENDDSTITYTLDDFFYGKELYMASKRQFRRMQSVFTNTDEKFNRIYLTDDFKFCRDESRFEVYVNGLRVDNTSFHYIPSNEKLPITAHYIVVNTPVTVGDLVDIFYLPMEIQELHYDVLSTYGMISMSNRSVLGFPFTENSYSLYANGKHITKDKISVTSSFGLLINTDIETRKNITIVKNIDTSDEIFELYKTTQDIWDLMQIYLPYTSLLALYGKSSDYEISDTEIDIKDDDYTNKQIYTEVLRREWIIDLTVIDPLKFFSYGLKDNTISKILTSPELCTDSWIIITDNDDDSYETDTNLKSFEITEGDSEPSYYLKKLSGDNSILILSRKIDTSIIKQDYSASIYVWLDTPDETLENPVHIIGYTTEGEYTELSTMVGIEVKDEDTYTLADIPQRQWTRLYSESISIDDNIDMLHIGIEIEQNDSIVHFMYGRFDTEKLPLNGTAVITLKAEDEVIYPLTEH